MPFGAVEPSNAENVQRGKKLEKKLQLREEVYNRNSGLHERGHSRELPTLLYILHIRPTENDWRYLNFKAFEQVGEEKKPLLISPKSRFFRYTFLIAFTHWVLGKSISSSTRMRPT